MACTGYPIARRPAASIKGKKVPDIPIDELCPKCGRNMMIATAALVSSPLAVAIRNANT